MYEPCGVNFFFRFFNHAVQPQMMARGLEILDMSRVMRKPYFCTCENKDSDQLRGNREADQRLCFRYTGSIIPLLLKPEISSL